jgi:hypothetical protein
MNDLGGVPDRCRYFTTKGLPENKIPNKKIEKCFFEKVIIFV